MWRSCFDCNFSSVFSVSLPHTHLFQILLQTVLSSKLSTLPSTRTSEFFKLQGSLSADLFQVLRFFSIILLGAFCSLTLEHQSVSAFSQMQKLISETSLMVQWLRLLIPNAGGLGSIPDQGTKGPTCCAVWPKKKLICPAPTKVH